MLTAKYAVPEIAHRELELAASATLATRRGPAATTSQSRFDAAAGRDGRGLGGASTARSSTTIRTSSPSSRRSRRSHEISPPAAGSAAGQAHARRAGSRICGRSRGCSRGRSRGSCCRRWLGPGHGAARRARATWAGAAAADGAPSGRSSPASCPTPRWAAPRPTCGSRGATSTLWDDAEPRERIWARAGGGARAARSRSWCSSAAASGCSTPSRCCRRRSTGATRPSTRSRSCRSSCCGGCGAAGSDGGTASEQLGRVSLLTINGIASGLRNTGVSGPVQDPRPRRGGLASIDRRCPTPPTCPAAPWTTATSSTR